MSWRTSQTSAVADALRRLRSPDLRLDEIEWCATVVAEAEGHDDPERVIRRELVRPPDA
jgi:hypothetical protein